jgi:hypothetical protein
VALIIFSFEGYQHQRRVKNIGIANHVEDVVVSQPHL